MGPSAPDVIDELGLPLNIHKGILVAARAIFVLARGSPHFAHHREKLVAAACICVAARQVNYLLSTKDLAGAAACMNPAAINRAAHRVRKVYNLAREPVKIEQYVAQLGTSLDLPKRARDLATQIAAQIDFQTPPGLQGRLPAAVAGAVIYVASKQTGNKISGRIIAQHTRVALVTLTETRQTLVRLRKSRPSI